MLMRTFAAAGLLVAISAPAMAAHQVTLSGTTPPAGYTVFEDFEGFAEGAPLGPNAVVSSDSQAGVSARPDGSTGNYATVLGGGTATFILPNPASAFGFLLGSLDTYNSLTINFADGGSVTYSGDAITEGQGSSGFLTLDYSALGRQVTSATFSSTQNSFEFDNLAFAGAVPEPSTWAMLILGFGVVGGAMRRRQKATIAFA